MDLNHVHRIECRPLDLEADLQNLFDWLGDTDVQRWYSEGEHSLENYRQ